MGQKGLLILGWRSFSDLLGSTRRPLSSQLVLVVLVSSPVWTEAIDQLELELEALVRASKPSTPYIGAASRSGPSLQVHRIPRDFPNERRCAENNLARIASEASAVVSCKV